jgi:hypothetical protein
MRLNIVARDHQHDHERQPSLADSCASHLPREINDPLDDKDSPPLFFRGGESVLKVFAPRFSVADDGDFGGGDFETHQAMCSVEV